MNNQTKKQMKEWKNKTKQNGQNEQMTTNEQTYKWSKKEQTNEQ